MSASRFSEQPSYFTNCEKAQAADARKLLRSQVAATDRSVVYNFDMQTAHSSLSVNPYLLIKLVRDGGSIPAVTVRAPVKGESMRVTKITRAAEPEIFTTLLIHSQTNTLSLANFTPEETARLAQIGVLLRPEEVSSPVWFLCDVNDPPLDLVPPRARQTMGSVLEVSDLVVNPTLQHLGAEGPTPAMRGHVELSNVFHPDRFWITIDNPVTGTPCLYSYSEEIAEEVNALQPGRPIPKIVSPKNREWLFKVGVIESASEAARLRDRCRRERVTAGNTLRHDRYVILPHMLAPLQLAAIRRYYRAVIAEGFLPFGDEEWPNRYFSGRDPIAYFYHEQLTGLISELAGERVKASFCFFASYYPGSTLPAHRDREQCEWALSLPIDQSPEAETSSWPLYLQPPGSDRATPVFTGVGDGTLYYGREVGHHRAALTTEKYCSFWFMFYVPESFAGSLD